MKKLAIIGASYLQKPLIERAKELGYETHVFAWRQMNWNFREIQRKHLCGQVISIVCARRFLQETDRTPRVFGCLVWKI